MIQIIFLTLFCLFLVVYSIWCILEGSNIKQQRNHDKDIDNELHHRSTRPLGRSGRTETGANDYPYNTWQEYYEEAKTITK